mmetsp:Transcript_43574/g.79349  ORF Transcript_43574/g.79349 Transcript_43574/m.79349 type:complete len:658 (+) Transcript_43574:77-2050(+)
MAVVLTLPPQHQRQQQPPFLPPAALPPIAWGQQPFRLTPEAWQALLARNNTTSTSSSAAPGASVDAPAVAARQGPSAPSTVQTTAAVQAHADNDQRRGTLRLEYCDASSAWHACQVLSVAPSGDMQVSIDQGLWLTLADQATKLRLAHPSMSQGLQGAAVAVGDGSTTARQKNDRDPWKAPPWADRSSQGPRRQLLGLDDAKVKAFTMDCEFISLGCYCGTAFALQTIGLKAFSYPFDWLRSPVEGVIQLLESGFQNFLTYSTKVDKGDHGELYGETRWGGSFWHHNPADPVVLQEFGRRVDRLTGQRSTDVAMAKTRVFVRVANSTSELGSTLRLHQALQKIIPTRCLLLVLIDMQKDCKVFHVDGMRDVLFCTVQDSVFQEPGVHWKVQMQFGSEAYAYAIARAIRLWALGPSSHPVEKVPSLSALEARCLPYDGGNAASELYVPKRVEGARVARAAPLVQPTLQVTTAPLVAPQVAASPSMHPPMGEATAPQATPVAFQRQLSPGRGPMPEVVTWNGVALSSSPFVQTPQQLMAELPKTMPDLYRGQPVPRRLFTNGFGTPTMPPPTRLVTYDAALLKAAASPPVVRTCTSPGRTCNRPGAESPCEPPPSFLRPQRQPSASLLPMKGSQQEPGAPAAAGSPVIKTRASAVPPRP